MRFAPQYAGVWTPAFAGETELGKLSFTLASKTDRPFCHAQQISYSGVVRPDMIAEGERWALE